MQPDDLEFWIDLNLAATQPNTVVITTKDIDFVDHAKVAGHSPKILYVNVGNVTNKELKVIVEKSFNQILQMF